MIDLWGSPGLHTLSWEGVTIRWVYRNVISPNLTQKEIRKAHDYFDRMWFEWCKDDEERRKVFQL